MHGRWMAAALVAAAVAAPPATAQTIHGTLVEALSGRPLAGGFVVLLDTAGIERGRTLTDDVGAYVLVAPRAGWYRLRTEVIGLRSWTSPLIQIQLGETLEYALDNPAPPVVLAAVVVTGDRVCGGQPDEGAAMAALWEEARKGLMAVRWNEQRRSLKFRIKRYERDLDRRRRRLREDSVVTDAYSLAPFRSIDAQQLASRGYVYRQDGAWWYHAPDAEVIFSEPFLATHCFRAIEGAGDRDGRIGLAFDPVRGRNVPDVSGALWLDRTTAELRELEFGYTSLPFDIPSEHVGGRVGFARLPSGAWIVRDWWIRMPTVGIANQGRPGRNLRRHVLLGYKQDGGEVLGVVTSDGVRPLPQGGAGWL